MNINETIFEGIKDIAYDKYVFNSSDIENFILDQMDFEQRRKLALNIIEDIMTNHGKRQLLHQVAELARIEQGIKELEPRIRDHVIHALLSFILGIYINEKFLPESIGLNVDEFEWKIAGLLHDVGYPTQIANDILKQYSKKMNGFSQENGGMTEDIFFKIVPKNFERLKNNLNSFDLIQKKLDEWELEINAKKEFDKNIKRGEICHGMLSAISTLRIIDLIYQKYNPNRKYEDVYIDGNINCNQKNFDNQIISACSAIFIHNLPYECFKTKKIDRNKAPIAFLLKLSDSLQDWDRPTYTEPLGFPSAHYDIEITNRKLILHTSLSDNRREKIENEIKSTLLADDVVIL